MPDVPADAPTTPDIVDASLTRTAVIPASAPLEPEPSPNTGGSNFNTGIN